jgi:hypothetical protein
MGTTGTGSGMDTTGATGYGTSGTTGASMGTGQVIDSETFTKTEVCISRVHLPAPSPVSLQLSCWHSFFMAVQPTPMPFRALLCVCCLASCPVLGRKHTPAVPFAQTAPLLLQDHERLIEKKRYELEHHPVEKKVCPICCRFTSCTVPVLQHCCLLPAGLYMTTALYGKSDSAMIFVFVITTLHYAWGHCQVVVVVR